MRIIIEDIKTRNQIIINNIKWLQQCDGILLLFYTNNTKESITIEKNDFITIEA